MDIVTYALLKKQLGTAISNFANEYDPNTQYSIGEIVIYKNELKRALESTTGEFDASKWQDVTVADLVSGENALIISALSHTTIEGYAVPQLTDEQLLAAYNGVVAGRNVFIVDDLDYITIQVLDASSIDGISIRLLFTDALILTYKENGVINYVNLKKFNMDTFVFKGYVSNTEPTDNIKEGQLWYDSDDVVMPTVFPIQVNVYDGEEWSTDTEDYAPNTLELWANLNNAHGYYWFGNEWNIIDIDISVDNTSIDKNTLGQIEIKNQGVTNDKINDALKALSVSTNPSDNKLVTESTLANYIRSGNLGDPYRLDEINLNTVDKTGFYFCNVCVNRPVTSNGVMIVSRTIGASPNIVQVYFAFSLDEIYVRFKDGVTWKDWKKYYNKTEIDTLLADVEQGIEDINDLIPENASTDNKFATEQEILFNSVGTGLVVENNTIKIDDTLYYNKAGVDGAVNRMMDLLVSRGEQLIINGSGFLGDNTNFSQLEFDGGQANGSVGSFTSTTKTRKIFVADYGFPVDPSLIYIISLDAKSFNRTASMYSMVTFYDSDGNSIEAVNHMYVAGTLTTLAQDLKNGDTTVYLTDISNWRLTDDQYYRRLTFWNYTNSQGYLYPELTYSRNTYEAYNSASDVDIVNGSITLMSPWRYGDIPAGTKVSQGGGGSRFKYQGLSNTKPPVTWTHYTGKYEGTDYSGENVSDKFPPGTSYGKFGFYWNYSNSTTDQVWVTNISVRSVSPTVPTTSNDSTQ